MSIDFIVYPRRRMTWTRTGIVGVAGAGNRSFQNPNIRGFSRYRTGPGQDLIFVQDTKMVCGWQINNRDFLPGTYPVAFPLKK
jgi:hypothetical protein